MSVTGFATPEGTERYRQRSFDSLRSLRTVPSEVEGRHARCHPDHFRRLHGAWVSSIGAGTYLGDPNERTDALYAEALEAALAAGCNLLDTAINYRFQRSERVIGAVLERLIAQGAVRRDEFVLCTKGGYLPFDGAYPADPNRYLIDTFLSPGLIQYDDLVAGCHCLAPRYLEHQLAASLANLRVETLDVYYLHNPEQQLDEVPRETFLERMEAAFRLLEDKAREGAIRWYGTATWNGYRANPNDRAYLSLEELVGIARRIAGEAHHFRMIQAPFNVAMPEAFGFKNQLVGGRVMSLLEAASAFGMAVVTSAGLLQSRLASLPAQLARFFPGLATDAQRALQFARSAPGVTTALVGMKRREHVEENLALAAQPALSREGLERLFTRERRTAAPEPPEVR